MVFEHVRRATLQLTESCQVDYMGAYPEKCMSPAKHFLDWYTSVYFPGQLRESGVGFDGFVFEDTPALPLWNYDKNVLEQILFRNTLRIGKHRMFFDVPLT